jgi:hypothetical protein
MVQYTHRTVSTCLGKAVGNCLLQGSSLGGSGGNNDGVLHGVVLLKGLDELGDGGSLLTDGDVDTVELLGLVGTLVPSLSRIQSQYLSGLQLLSKLRTG